MDLTLKGFLCYIGGGVNIVLSDFEVINKVYWKGTVDEYFKI